MNNVQSKGQIQENCVFHFLLQHDILDWFAEIADEFAGPPDEPELSLEWPWENITSKQHSNQWNGLSFTFFQTENTVSQMINWNSMHLHFNQC